MLAEERRDLVALLRTLADSDWEAPSLCAGWRVRDVVAHMVSITLPLRSYVGKAVLSGSADRLNNRLVDELRALSPGELVDRIASAADGGWDSRLIPSIMLADTVVHHQDIRRPLGRPRTVPAPRLLSVLEHPDPLARPGRRIRGLRLVATDVSWSKGAGPEVRGPGEALALAMAGRGVAMDELTGDGVDLLRSRL